MNKNKILILYSLFTILSNIIMLIVTLKSADGSYYTVSALLPVKIAGMNIVYAFGWIGIILRTNNKKVRK